MTPDQPQTYPRRILLAVTGLSPQIVTETVYALAVQSQPAWIPHEIHLVTTARGADNAKLKLLSEKPGWFHHLRSDYALPPIAFDDSYIHVIERGDGSLLDDIRDDEDNRLAADFITEIVRQLTSDPDSAIHASLAGGRKTMGFYLGYAMSLYGRAQDRLSHVLVSAPFESHPEFYYPTPTTQVITSLDRGQDALDCNKARVWLGAIPFVRLREGLPERLLAGKATFSEVVSAAGRALHEPRLVLDLHTQEVFADEERIGLGPTEFLVLWWFAVRAGEEGREINWSDPGAVAEILDLARRLWKTASGEYERLEKALKNCKDDPKALGDYFEPHKSRINKGLEAALGRHAAQRYMIQRTGQRGRSRYFLPLLAEQIEIRE